MGALGRGGVETISVKERQRLAAESGGCAVGAVTGTGSLATAYGV